MARNDVHDLGTILEFQAHLSGATFRVGNYPKPWLKSLTTVLYGIFSFYF